MEEIIVVGGGPAGLTAAIYIQRAGKHALVFEGNVPGGQIVTTPSVKNYPAIKEISGADYATELYEQALALGAEVKFAKVVGISLEGDIKTIHTAVGDFQAKAVILATGSLNRKLGVDGENKFLGKGVSYCATCDGALYKNKNVAVVGGGNTALEDAKYLSDFVKKLYLIHRRNEFRGDQATVKELASKKNVEFVLEANVSKLFGTNSLEKIEVSKLDGTKRELDVDGLFVAVGQVPGNGAFENLVTLDSMGYVVAGEDCKTKIDGIFVAGDARTKTIRQLTTAAADGTVAGLAAVNYVRQK